MITQRKYVPIIKTGEAEIKAISNIDDNVQNFILPLFELTRGRKKQKEDEGKIEKKIQFLKDKFKSIPFILDLTGIKDLSNTEIEQLHSSKDSYKNWITFCKTNKEEFGTFYPVVQIEEEEEYGLYIEKLNQQITELCKYFDYIVFRSQGIIEARDLISDIKTILDRKSSKNINLKDKIIYVLDYKYINNAEQNIETAKTFINVLTALGIKNIVLSSTSFPANVSEYMNPSNYITFNMKELDFYKKVLNEVSSKDLNLVYSDYSSINPIRNDNVFARGWIPRIDVPSIDKKIHCLRKKRPENTTYADTYILVAREVIQKKYFKDLINQNITSWGLDTIMNAALGNVEGAAPRFWISVRMNIYLTLLEKKLSEFIGI